MEIALAWLSTVMLLIVFLLVSFPAALVVRDEPVKSDAIVILGCPMDDAGMPGSIARTRLDRGIELFRAGLAPRLILCGGAVKNRHVEAEGMRAYAIQAGVPEAALLLDRSSRDTVTNLLNAVSILREHGWTQALLVSSKYHTKRVRLLLGRYPEIRARMIPADDPPHHRWSDRLYDIGHERVMLFLNLFDHRKGGKKKE